MKNRIIYILFTALLTGIVILSCRNDGDDNKGINPIIGVWKLVEVSRNGQPLTLSACELMETYIIGETQYSLETFKGSKKKYALQGKGNDDNNNNDDDDHNSSEDSGNNGSTNCTTQKLTVGSWGNTGLTYNFVSESGNNSRNITFMQDNTKFYFEISNTVNGTVSSTKYVYQRQ